MTRADLSIVIPTLNAQAHLPRCLDALSSGLMAGLIKEVVIVDGGSTDETITLAGLAGCRIISSPKAGRGRQLRVGASNAKAEWLLFLHADSTLEPDWVKDVAAHMYFPQFAASFTLAYDSPTPEARWLEKRAALRVKTLGLPYGDQGLIIHRDLYEEVGGFEDVPLMEDVSIIRRIGRHRLKHFQTRAITSGDKYARDGWRKRAWRNAILLARYYLGASPEKLAQSYD